MKIKLFLFATLAFNISQVHAYTKEDLKKVGDAAALAATISTATQFMYNKNVSYRTEDDRAIHRTEIPSTILLAFIEDSLKEIATLTNAALEKYDLLVPVNNIFSLISKIENADTALEWVHHQTTGAPLMALASNIGGETLLTLSEVFLKKIFKENNQTTRIIRRSVRVALYALIWGSIASLLIHIRNSERPTEERVNVKNQSLNFALIIAIKATIRQILGELILMNCQDYQDEPAPALVDKVPNIATTTNNVVLQVQK